MGENLNKIAMHLTRPYLIVVMREFGIVLHTFSSVTLSTRPELWVDPEEERRYQFMVLAQEDFRDAFQNLTFHIYAERYPRPKLTQLFTLEYIDVWEQLVQAYFGFWDGFQAFTINELVKALRLVKSEGAQPHRFRRAYKRQTKKAWEKMKRKERKERGEST